jgi:hypothetical protein
MSWLIGSILLSIVLTVLLNLWLNKNRKAK